MKSESANILIVGIILVVLVSIGIGYGVSTSIGQNNNPTPQVTNQPEEQITPTTAQVTPIVSPTGPTYNESNVQTFVSDDLGIRLAYISPYGGETFGVKQMGNKIYVYDMKYPVTQGQYIEVFTKDPNDSLVSAITKKFLGSYNASDCLVKQTNNPVGGKPTPPGFEIAQITVPMSENESMKTLSVKWDKCPSPYTATNGIAYFLAEATHPTQFAFLSIGQYVISGPNKSGWQDSVQFLK